LNIGILSGDEEAELTYLGGISEYLRDSSEIDYAVLDIDSVRMTERFLKTSPPRSTALANA